MEENKINRRTLDNGTEFEMASVDNEIQVNSDEAKGIKKQIIKNLITASFGLLLVYSSFQTVVSLQSSVNKREGIGTTSLGVAYVLCILSAMFLSTCTINHLGVRKTLVLSGILYSVYIAANFYPSWYTMVSGAVFLGVGGTYLWTALPIYIAEISGAYSTVTNFSLDLINARFFGVTFVINMIGYVLGSLLSYFILQQSSASQSYGNSTVVHICGAQFCPSEEDLVKDNANLERPDDMVLYTLLGIFTVAPLLGAVLFGAVLSGGELEKKKYSSLKESLKSLTETYHHLKNNYQKLLIPLTVYSGLEKAFLMADYTQAFVGCASGIPNISHVIMCYGAFAAVSGLCIELVVKVVGRFGVFVIGAVIHFITLIAMLLWQPTGESSIFFIISGLWGLAEMAWQCNITSIYGLIFPNSKVGAYSNLRIWFSAGYFLGFVYSKFFCTNVKIYILICLLGVGMVCYFAIEIHSRHNKKIPKQNVENTK